MAIQPDTQNQPRPAQPDAPKRAGPGQASPTQAPQRGGIDANPNEASSGSPLHGRPGQPDGQTGSETVEVGAGNGSQSTFDADQKPPRVQQGQSSGPGDGGANDTEPLREARAPTVGPKKSLR